MLFFVFFSLEHIITFPTVKELAMSDALFGIYPNSNIDIVWNPAFTFSRNNYYLDFVRLNEYYDDFRAYRVIVPIISGNKFRIGGMISVSEKYQYPDLCELHEHNRGEIFFGYNGSIKYGTSIFLDHKDWWYEYPKREASWNTVIGAKLGFVFTRNSSFSIIISKEDTASNFESLSYIRLTSHNYGIALLATILPHKELSFIGAYHVTNLEKVKFIKGLKIESEDEKIKYSIPLVLDLNVLKELSLYSGYTLQIQCFNKEIKGDKSISMGFTYAPSLLAITVNMGAHPFGTYWWEASFSYGN